MYYKKELGRFVKAAKRGYEEARAKNSAEFNAFALPEYGRAVEAIRRRAMKSYAEGKGFRDGKLLSLHKKAREFSFSSLPH